MIIKCKACGSNIRFDIASQKLHCDYCGNSYAPWDFEDEGDTFDAVTYTCRNCGAELITTDNTEATAYCSYCGSSSILTGRLEKLKKPDRILPFRITKEKCREIYLKQAKKTFLAPKWLKEESCVDGFRAIYMPYWTYTVHASGRIGEIVARSYRNGDYIVETTSKSSTEEFDTDVAGWSHDASTAFADDISETIGFDSVKESDMVPFHQGYLSGFYADMAEEAEQAHKEIAMSETRNRLEHSIRGTRKFYGHLSVKNHKLNYMPVWFMSMRHGDSLTYAAVNGYTGKIVADFPVSTRGFFAIAGIAAAAVSVLLCMTLVLRPEPAFWLAMLVAAIGLIVCAKEELRLSEISDKIGNTPCSVISVRSKPVGVGLIILAVAVLVVGLWLPIEGGGFWILLFFGLALIAGIVFVKRKQPLRFPVRTLLSFIACGACALLLRTRANVFIYPASVLVAGILSYNCLSAFRIHQAIARRRPPHFDREGDKTNA